jgi:subtilase family serine protease
VLALVLFGTTISGRELAIVGVVVLVIIGALIWFVTRRRR